MPRSLRRLAFAGASALALAGLFAASRLRSAVQAQTPAHEEPRSVEATRPRRQTMSRSLDVPATIRAYERVDIHAKVSGYVSEVRVDIGDAVRRGDVLASLSIPEMEKELAEARAYLRGKEVALEVARSADLQAAEAAVEEARAGLEVERREHERRRVELAFEERQLERKQGLHGEGAVTEEDLDEAKLARDAASAEVGIAEAQAGASESEMARAEADLAVASARIEVAEADVALAEARLARLETFAKYAHLVAPFDGIVTLRTVDPGALVQDASSDGGEPLFTVQRIDRVRISFDVPEVDVPFVSPGTRVTVEPYATVDVLEGRVSRLASTLKTGTRSMRAEIDLDNPDGKLLDGMYAQIVVEIDVRPDALTIPAAALLHEAERAFVYVVRDDVANKQELEIGLDDGIRVEVRSGLGDDDWVVVGGQGLISAGERVRAVAKEEIADDALRR